MSDDDFMQASDEEYDFEYEDDEEEESGDVDIENKYYNAKQMKSSDPADAVDEFLAIPGLEQEKSEWGFKGLKQAIKLEFKLERYDKVSLSMTCQMLFQVTNSNPGNRALRRAPHIR